MWPNPLRVILAWRYLTYAQNMSSKAVEEFPLRSLRLKSKTHLTRSVGAEIFKNWWPYRETRLARTSARCVEVKPIFGFRIAYFWASRRIRRLCYYEGYKAHRSFQLKLARLSNFCPTRNGKSAFIHFLWVYEWARGQNRPKNADPLPLVLSLTLLSPKIKYERSGRNCSD